MTVVETSYADLAKAKMELKVRTESGVYQNPNVAYELVEPFAMDDDVDEGGIPDFEALDTIRVAALTAVYRTAVNGVYDQIEAVHEGFTDRVMGSLDAWRQSKEKAGWKL
jgi:hypothetical protein